ncbi:MAG: ATP-binding protein [Clostridia bacterium]
MDEELKRKIYKILNELPTENSWLDYKELPYDQKRFPKFIKQLNGFLNSSDSYGKDKFILIGIDNNKKIKGLNTSLPMQDDRDFQDMAEKISPRPSLETGTIKYKENDIEYEIGYIYIPANKNTDRIYTINKDYPDDTTYINDLRNEIKTPRVYASTSWIRWGSTTSPLTEDDRRKIYKISNESKIDYSSIASTYYDLSKVDKKNTLLKMAILIGGWDESNEDDKQIISDMLNQPYNTLIEDFRLMLKDKDNHISFKNEKWQVEDRMNLLKSFADSYFKEDISKFQNKVIEILTQSNSKFDLPSDKRTLANIYGSIPKYSDLLKKSVAETLTMISAIEKEFINSTDSSKNLSYHVVSDVLKNADWKILASLDNVMPFLAEANPETFLKMWEDIIRESPEIIKSYMTSSERGIVDNYYTIGLYWSLQLIAWEERYLSRVCVILAQLSRYDKKAIENISGILLPWYPQTKASIDIRKSAVENVIKESENCGWNLVSELMPNKRTTGSPSYKPKWNNLIIDDENNTVLYKEYWEQVENYLEIFIKYSKTDIDRLCDLVDLMDDLPKNMFEMIMIKISQKDIKKLSENKRYVLWNHMEDFINRHIKFADAKWSLPKEVLSKIEKLANELKPSSSLIYNKRFFRKDSWTLYDDRADYKKAEKKLYDLRVNIIKEINSINFESVIEFVNAIEDTYVAGICYAEILNKTKDEEKVLSYLDSKKEKETSFAKGFVYKKHLIYGYDWLNEFNIEKWSDSKKVNLLITLPSNQTTWDLVLKYLNDNQIIYWKIVDIRFVDENININYPMERLIYAGRPAVAISIINFSIRNNKTLEYDRNLAVTALNDILVKQDELNSLDIYHIRDVIKDLQNSNVPKTNLFQIEWAYLNLLTDSHDDGRPITIERELSENPEKYNEILSLAYKKHGLTKEEAEVVDEKIATNAYRLLNQWKIPPGLDDKGVINKIKLNNWYDKMKEICTQSDRLEVGLLNFGHVLYYSPEDKSGLWIDKNVAEILDDNASNIIRDGFRTEVFNSLGAINIDKDGAVYDNLADKYEEKAISIEKAGYSRIATLMRSLSDSYRNQAERTRERYDDFN